ncbi:MAG: DEAD/DEAH box helicase [bacterium]
MQDNRVELKVSFLFDTEKRLYLAVILKWQNQEVPLSLGTFIHFIYRNEKTLKPEDVEFCYLLSKIVKKINLQGQFHFAIPNDHDMTLLFLKAIQNKIPLFLEHNNCIRMIEKIGPIPLTVSVTQKGNALHCQLKDRKNWLTHPLAWLMFRTNDENICFSNGVLIANISNEFETFMNHFLDKETSIYKGHDIFHFINKVYQPNKHLIYWQIQADLSELMPQITTPIPLLTLNYHEPLLKSDLSFQYGATTVSSSDKNNLILDKKTGKNHQRIPEMEEDAQKDLMELFLKFDLPFMLQNPGDIAKFMDKVIPKLIIKGWLINSDVPQFAVQETPVDIQFKINNSGKDWFYFESNCDINGQNMSLQETARLMIQNQGYIKTKTGFVKLSEKSQKDLKTFAEAGALKVGQKFSKRDMLPFLLDSDIHAEGKSAQELIDQLSQINIVDSCKPDKNFKGDLRDYQQYGVNWLYFLCQTQFGGILADDMGLGKTVQTLAVSSKLDGNAPCLIIGPTNVIYNWAKEINTFLPKKNTLVYGGSNRHQYKKDIENYDYIITSYGIIKNDLETFLHVNFDLIVVDEAQYIKNPDTQISKALKKLQANIRLVLTGTPIENQLQDLWNLFDFVMPGYLGKKQDFEQLLKNKNLSQIRNKVKPFILRREKQEVLDALPEKTEVILTCPMSEVQKKLYTTVLDAARKGMTNAAGQRERLNILSALLKLRQVCTHPAMLSEFKGSNLESAKFDLFKDKVTELMAEHHKVVVFTQFTRMLDIMQKWLEEKNYYFERIDGSKNAKSRQTSIDRFQKETKPGVFLVSLKAGGVGINLTEADYVIHMDLWWNPAVEAQATDRVHRLGQKNKVIVYKFITEGTIEEKIQSLQEEKKALLSQIVEIDSLEAKKVNLSEIKALIME